MQVGLSDLKILTGQQGTNKPSLTDAPYIHEILILGDLVLAINTSADPVAHESNLEQLLLKIRSSKKKLLSTLRQSYHYDKTTLVSSLDLLYRYYLLNSSSTAGLSRAGSAGSQFRKILFGSIRVLVSVAMTSWNVYNMAGVDFSSN